LSVCLFVCLYPINVKTAEPIGAKFFVGQIGTPGKVYEWSKFQIFVSIKIRSSLNFLKFWKSTNFFVKIRELFLFYDVHKENMFTINLEDGREAPSKVSIINFGNSLLSSIFKSTTRQKMQKICRKKNKTKKFSRNKAFFMAWLLQGTLVLKLTLGPFLTLSIRNGHKLKDWGFRITTHIKSKSL